MRRTKVLATIGPASGDEVTLVRMIEAGMDAVRVNFSHGDARGQATLVQAARAAAETARRHVPVLQDLQGTKVRIGALEGGAAVLVDGQHVTLDADPAPGGPNRLPIDDRRVIDEAPAAGTVVLGDGEVVLQIEEATSKGLHCSVETGGRVRQGAGVTAPGVALPGGLTEKDRQDLAAGVDLDCDYVALSFVRNADEVTAARDALTELGGDAHLVAKIERHEALADLHAIIEAADGILVARGDLGLALPPEAVPVWQKRILSACAHAGRLSITATQMLESMVAHPRPTRAEASDVANAILDGTSVVMLSGETAVGAHPVAAVQVMTRVAAEAERAVYSGELEAPVHRGMSEGNVADAIALACAVTAEDLSARAVVAFTKTGLTAHRVAKHRPRVPVIAATPDVRVARRLKLLWGVTPIVVAEAETLDAMVRTAEVAAKERGLVESGDLVVITGGDVGVPGSTNLMRVGEVS